MKSHLSSEEFDGVLSGQSSAEAAQHLQSCERCAQELGSLRGVFGDFQRAATASAEHHRYLVPAPSARRVPRMGWAFAMAALCVGIAAPVALRHHSDAPAVNVAQGGAVAVAPVEISDDALLNGVQDDLSVSVPEPLTALSGSAQTTTSNSSNSN